jgi:hypothetical protein
MKLEFKLTDKGFIKKRSNVVYNTILKLQKWLIINCIINDVRFILLGLSIFKGEILRNNYIKFYRLKICMAM